MSRFFAIGCILATMAATSASAATFSVPAPSLPSGFTNVADRQMTVAVNNTHLRSKPTAQATKVATLKMGTTVDVVELVGNGAWAHVKVAGQTGYIRADLLK